VPEFESFKSGTEHEKQDESGRGYLPVLQSEKLSGYSVSKAPAKSEGTEHGVGNEIRGGQTRIYKGIRGKAQESGRGSEDAPAAEILFHVPDLDESNVGGIQAAVDAESQSCYVKDLDDSPVSGIQASAPVQPVSAPPPPSPVQLPAAQGMVTLRSVRGSAATPEPPSPRTVATSFSPKFKTVSGKELGAGIGSGYGVGGFGAGDRDESEKKTDISYRLEGKKKPDARNAGTTRRIDMIEPADATEAFAPADLPPGPGETAASGPEPVYPPQVYNPIIETKANPFSTFGIDVDTASFTLARRYLLGGRLPPTGAIRVEEFVNAFEYAYKPPENTTFAVYCDRTRSPFRPSLEVLRIGVRGKVLGRDRQRPLALTFIVDTSGSMNTPDRLELARKAMTMLLDRLTDADSMAIVTFGSKARLVLDHTRAARKDEIRAAIASLQTSGSTHLEGGIRVGYEVAARRFRSGAANRVMIFSDGVANLGAATSDEILKQVETYRKQGVFCSVFGLGVGAYNDAMLQALADKGDGVYRYLDSLAEAKRVLVDEAAATLHVIAKDVKIQVEFQPDRVKAYRQIGYEKRHLEKEQFRDDAVDAGEVGSGQSSTALYELETSGAADSPLGIVRLRWKDPETGLVTETAHPIRGSDKPAAFEDAPPRFRLAVGVAELADWMRENPLSIGTEGGDILKVVRTAGMELNLDRQVKDVVRMATAASRLKKR
jgi:Ca-activated chloride channel family protein